MSACLITKKFIFKLLKLSYQSVAQLSLRVPHLFDRPSKIEKKIVVRQLLGAFQNTFGGCHRPETD
jgi:hypothetical protein